MERITQPRLTVVWAKLQLLSLLNTSKSSNQLIDLFMRFFLFFSVCVCVCVCVCVF